MTSEARNSVATPEELQLWRRLESIFMPYATRQRRRFYEESGGSPRFAHYTSAEAALRIIASKRIWMRNATCMSDYREVEHGFDILEKFFRDESNEAAFISALDASVPGAAQEALNLFRQWSSDFRISTYITSTSEHGGDQDSNGLLSMWRAFGGHSARVAIVFKVPEFSEGSIALNLMFSPVAYLKAEDVHKEARAVIESLGSHGEFLSSVDRSDVIGNVFNMLVAGVTCLKHEGFREEREWRVLYAPKRMPSLLMESSTEVIDGIPQTVYKIPVDVTKSDTLADLDLARIFDRMIIGPSEYSWVMYEAFVAALGAAGVADAGARVRISAIPIRA